MVGFESSNLPQSTSPNPAKIGSKVRINCPDSRLHEYEAELTGFTPSGNMKLANGSNME